MNSEQLVYYYNKRAMEYLKEQNFEESLKCLMKAQENVNQDITRNTSKYKALTFNNFGIYYKSLQKYDIAMKYLQKSMKIQKVVYDSVTLAGTYMNMSAIYSQIGDHNTALSHASIALKILKAEASKSSKNIPALILALHNIGIEYELLGDIQKAASTYKYGLDLSQQFLGNSHQYTSILLKYYLAISEKGKKYYFERAKINSSISISKNHEEFVLPKVQKYFSQRPSPSNDYKKAKTKSKLYKTHIFSDGEVETKNSFPDIGKPSTFGGRIKNVPTKKNYINTLEKRVTFLQSQLFDFENRYKKLEKNKVAPSRKKPSNLAVQKKVSKSIKVIKEKAAVIIQKFWRRYKAQKQLKTLKQTKNMRFKGITRVKVPKESPKPNFLTKLQTLEIKNLSTPTPKYKQPIKPSEAFRRYSLHPITESKIETKAQKATLIQSHIRRFIQQRKYKRIRDAAIKIQSHIRRYLVNSLFQSITLAVKFIQKQWRSYQAQKN
ncbi:hypothetical protein SteCoe_28376 [Stentor coeruleus]|uniref:Uncharacterized protein n=1 Tax=Stentor coeruleus TaxID=5963 RepID=A0A1R2B8H4_9CILI|nr:hypothetical protein SteCoe_28376 [Stentor coeruleus]